MTAGYKPDHWDAVRTGEREEEDQEPYCRECGGDDLAYLEQYADSSGEYKCRTCGKVQQW